MAFLTIFLEFRLYKFVNPTLVNSKVSSNKFNQGILQSAKVQCLNELYIADIDIGDNLMLMIVKKMRFWWKNHYVN